MAKKRGRRRSSVSSLKALSLDSETSQADPSHGSDFGTRKRAMSKSSILATPSSSNASGSKAHVSNGPPIVRPHYRKRTSSVSSSIGSQLTYGSVSLDGSTSATSSGFLRDTSQLGLENVLHSRLIETFITITIIDQSFSCGKVPSTTPSYLSSSAVPQHSSTPASARRSTIVASGSNTLPSRASLSKPRISSTIGSVGLRRVGPSSGHAKSISVHAIPNGKAQRPSALKTFQRAPIPSPLTTSKQESITSECSLEPEPNSDHTTEPLTPDYLSPIHRPSTNPLFTIDAKGGIDFAPQADLSGHTMKVEIWGRVFMPLPIKGKGKEREDTAAHIDVEEQEWKILETWDVDLNNLIPLQDVSALGSMSEVC